MSFQSIDERLTTWDNTKEEFEPKKLVEEKDFRVLINLTLATEEMPPKLSWTTDENSIVVRTGIYYVSQIHASSTVLPEKFLIDKASKSLDDVLSYYRSNLAHFDKETLDLVMEEKSSKLVVSYGDKLVRPILSLLRDKEDRKLDALSYLIIKISQQVKGYKMLLFQFLFEELLKSENSKIKYAAVVGLSYIDDRHSLKHLKRALSKETNRYLIPVFNEVIGQLEEQKTHETTSSQNQ